MGIRTWDTPKHEEEVGQGPHEFRMVGRIAGAIRDITFGGHIILFQGEKMCEETVLIPAYEPDAKLIHFLGELKRDGFGLVVVDDGSGPQYRSVFEQAKKYANVISYETNRGKGYALKTGLQSLAADKDKESIIITADADGQHKAEDVLRIADEAKVYRKCLMLGCRKFEGKVPLRSRLGNGITGLVFKLATGTGISDTQTGLRAFHLDMVPFLTGIPGERYEYEMNMLIASAKKKIPLREVPIETVYLNDNKGSHFHVFRDSFLIYRDILKFAASSFVSFILDYGMFLVFSALFSGFGSTVMIGAANVCARVVSASFNYTVNKKYIFKNREHPAKSLVQYAALAAFILVFNTAWLEILVNGAGIHRFLAKILTEITFFMMSFMVQKFIIFKKKEGNT